MTSQDLSSLFTSLDEAVDILNANRTSDPEFIAAFDTLKQARAMVARLNSARSQQTARTESDLAAA